MTATYAGSHLGGSSDTSLSRVGPDRVLVKFKTSAAADHAAAIASVAGQVLTTNANIGVQVLGSTWHRREVTLAFCENASP